MAKRSRSKRVSRGARHRSRSVGTSATGRRPDRVVAALAAVGMAITAYLTGVAWTGTEMAFCGAGSSCDVVQQSRWSTLLGLPIALWGFLTYALIGALAAGMRPSVRRWRWLWLISLVGVAVSAYLTVVGAVNLDAVCGYCLGSLATITAIFGAVAARPPVGGIGRSWWDWGGGTAGAAALVVFMLHLHYSGVFDPAAGPEEPRLKALAIHLQETGAKFYGAYWCPHCQHQKELFGASAHRLPYVECTPEGRNGPLSGACRRADIRQYPTWIIDGERYAAVLEPRLLARYSGFDWGEYEDGRTEGLRTKD